MSKSYKNTIDLSSSEDEIRKSVKDMFTDPKRIKLTDPGHPEECNVYSYYEVFAPEKSDEVYQWCSKAQKGCTECKMILADRICDYLKPMREKRVKLEQDKGRIREILEEGRKKAQKIAHKTMAEIKEVIF